MVALGWIVDSLDVQLRREESDCFEFVAKHSLDDLRLAVGERRSATGHGARALRYGKFAFVGPATESSPRRTDWDHAIPIGGFTDFARRKEPR